MLQPSRRSHYWRTTVQAVAGAWRNWWERQRELARLNQVDAPGSSEVARELGLSATELRTLVGRGKDSAGLLKQRLQTLDIAPSRIEPGVMRDLQRCCSQCHDKALCAHELEDRPKEASWPSYCPNEHTIRALQTEQQSSKVVSPATVEETLAPAGMSVPKGEITAESAAEARLKKAQSQFYSLE